MDPESQFLIEMRLNSKRSREVEDEYEFEWDNYKENVKPLKRGRNVKLLNESLKSHSNLPLKQSLLLNRRKLIAAIDEYVGDDPLQPWLQCIKWVQQAFPAGGDSSSLLVISEQCVRTFWHDDRYQNDLRYVKVWLEYAENCADAEVIYRFLDANNIGQSHSAYYISYALHMEAKHKIKTANEIFNRGLSMNAQPQEKLEVAYRKFLARSVGRPKTTTDEDATENNQSTRSFGTVLSDAENRILQIGAANAAKKSAKDNRGERNPLSVYKDTNIENSSIHRLELTKDTKSWDSLPTHKDRNKENKAIPAKWTSYKVLPKPGSRLGRGAAPAIDVFVDEDCTELHQNGDPKKNSTSLLKERDDEDNFKRETELLKENPLRNFPASSFAR